MWVGFGPSVARGHPRADTFGAFPAPLTAIQGVPVLKKMGVVTVGVAAGLLAAAPFASATECHDGDHHESKRSHSSESNCNVTGGSSEANSGINGDSLANVVAQVPVGGANIANLTCNSILNDNVSGNQVNLDLL